MALSSSPSSSELYQSQLKNNNSTLIMSQLFWRRRLPYWWMQWRMIWYIVLYSVLWKFESQPFIIRLQMIDIKTDDKTIYQNLNAYLKNPRNLDKCHRCSLGSLWNCQKVLIFFLCSLLLTSLSNQESSAFHNFTFSQIYS